MLHVCMENIETGKQDSCGVYSTVKEAIEKIRICYNIDKKNGQLGIY